MARIAAFRILVTSRIPEVTIKRRSEPTSATPSASMARRSDSEFVLNFDKSTVEVRNGRAGARTLRVCKITAIHRLAGRGERFPHIAGRLVAALRSAAAVDGRVV
jgi:hypothetical protein